MKGWSEFCLVIEIAKAISITRASGWTKSSADGSIERELGVVGGGAEGGGMCGEGWCWGVGGRHYPARS